MSLIDVNYDIPLNCLIGNTTTFVNYLQDHSLSSFFYYYSFATFSFTILFHLVFLNLIVIYIKNKRRYAKEVAVPYVIMFLASCHNIYLFPGFAQYRHYRLYLYGSAFLSLLKRNPT